MCLCGGECFNMSTKYWRRLSNTGCNSSVSKDTAPDVTSSKDDKTQKEFEEKVAGESEKLHSPFSLVHSLKESPLRR